MLLWWFLAGLLTLGAGTAIIAYDSRKESAPVIVTLKGVLVALVVIACGFISVLAFIVISIIIAVEDYGDKELFTLFRPKEKERD